MEATNAAVNVSNVVSVENLFTRNHVPNDSPKPKVSRLKGWLIMGCLMLWTFAQATQSTYLLATITYMEDDLDIAFREAFVTTAMFLSGMTLAQAIGHDLPRIIGRLPVFVFATILLTTGTVFGALARGKDVFTAGRILQGAGAGIAEAVKAHIVIVVLDVSTSRRSTMAAFLDYTWMFGFAAGPLIGICFENTRLGWQVSFWLVVPLVVLSGVCMIFLLDLETKEEKAITSLAKKTNPVSQGVLIAATVSLFSGLINAGSSRGWSSPLVFGWLTASLACCIFLVVFDKFAPWWERLFRKSAFKFSTYLRLVDVFLNSCLTWILLFFLAIHILRFKSAEPIPIALHALSVALTAAVIAMVTNLRASESGYNQAIALAGWISLIGAFAMLCLLGSTETDATLVMIGIFGGFGIGASFWSPFAHHTEGFDKNDQTHKIRVTWQVRAAGQTFGLLLGSAVFGNELHRRGVADVLIDLDLLVPGRDHPDSFVNMAILDSLKLVWIIALAFACLGFVLSCVLLCEKSDIKRKPSHETNGRRAADEEGGVELGQLRRRQAPDNPFADPEEEISETETLSESFVEAVVPPEVEEDTEGAETPEVRGDPNVSPTIRWVPKEEEDDLDPWSASVHEPRQFV